ncbi:hypothetical protein [Acetobacterium wieringae]|nr:hypothetical protein [Acetobacterium wieringae]
MDEEKKVTIIPATSTTKKADKMVVIYAVIQQIIRFKFHHYQSK